MDKKNLSVDELLEISSFINREDLTNDLQEIKRKLQEPNKSITIPLVGEFSSGKTSLINGLLENNNLETASQATTATIFEIHFGSQQSFANVISEDGKETKITDFAELKNNDLAATKVVQVYDPSDKIPSSTILVDTPGLSSNDPRHKLALTSYLPFADAVFLVTDINQQLTKSLLDFIESSNLSQKPVYLIVTKSDTKSVGEVEAARKYAFDYIQQANLSINDIIVISSAENEMAEFYALIDKIQIEKNEIVTKVLLNRLNSIAMVLSDFIDELIKSSASTASLEKQIEQNEYDLERIERNIKRLISDAGQYIEEKNHTSAKNFEQKVSSKLEMIVKNQGRDIDNEVYEAVNNTATHIVYLYKKDIQSVLTDLARKRRTGMEAVPLQFLESLDLNTMSLPQFSYDMNLSELGHKHDKAIGYGVLAVAAAAAIWVAAPAVAAASTVASAGTQSAAQLGLGTAATVTDAVNIGTNLRTVDKLRKFVDKGHTLAQKGMETYRAIDETVQTFTPEQRVVMETSVGWATDKFVGKPQRQKAVRSYVEDTLLPEFSTHMDFVRTDLINTIGLMLNEEARAATAQLEDSLNQLNDERKSSKEQYHKKIVQLKEFKSILNKS